MNEDDKTFLDEVLVEEVTNTKVEDIIYFVKAGDTISSNAQKFCVKSSELIQDNEIINDAVEEGDILWIRRRNQALYVVKPADTIDKIAKKFGVTPNHICTLNNIHTVFIGQKIII